MFDDNYIGNWIDDAVKSACHCLRLGFDETQIFEILQNSGCPEDMLSSILASAQILYVDEMAGK